MRADLEKLAKSYAGSVSQAAVSEILDLEDEEGDGVYGVRGRNHLRFVNHSPQPNAEFDGVELFSLTPIEPDEEITVDYGSDWADL